MDTYSRISVPFFFIYLFCFVLGLMPNLSTPKVDSADLEIIILFWNVGSHNYSGSVVSVWLFLNNSTHTQVLKTPKLLFAEDQKHNTH